MDKSFFDCNNSFLVEKKKTGQKKNYPFKNKIKPKKKKKKNNGKKNEEPKPKGKITTFAWIGLIMVGTDKNGDIWEWWGLGKWIKRELSKEEKS